MPIPRPIRKDLGYTNERFQRIERRIEEGRRAISVDSTTLEGDFTVDGGALALDDINGARLFTLGSITPTLDDGTFQRGWIVRRNDDTIVMALWDAFPGDGSPAQYRQALSWWDREGNIVIADDTDGPSGQGLARPYVPWQFSSAADQQAVTAAGFTTTHTLAAPRQHPRMAVGLSVTADAATAGNVRVLFGATVVAGPTVVPTGGSVAPGYLFTLPLGSHMDLTYVDIQAQRTAGTGSIRVRPFYAYGVQT